MALQHKYQLPVRVRLDEDLVYIARCPVVPGCVSQGDTLETALANLQDALQACVDVMKEDNSAILAVLEEFRVDMPDAGQQLEQLTVLSL